MNALRYWFGCAFFLAFSSAFAVPTLYIHDSSGRLGTVDVATGQAHLTGNLGVVLTDIAFSPTGQLYGMSFTDLYTIDTTDAHVTALGAHGISGGNALVFGADGTLYGAGTSTSSLYSIDTSSGRSQVLGNLGFQSAGDLAFHGSDFYLASTSGQLVKINIPRDADVTASAVGSFGVANMYGLATADDGSMYGLAGTGIYTIDTETGVATKVGDYGNQGLGASYGASFYTEAGAMQDTIEFVSTSAFASESDGGVTAALRRTGSGKGVVSVSYSSNQGSESRADPVSGTVVWQNGDMADKTISIPLKDDAIAKPSEVFAVRLATSSGAVRLGLAEFTLTVTDDDRSSPADADSIKILAVNGFNDTTQHLGQDVTVEIQVVDEAGNPVPGSALTWSLEDSSLGGELKNESQSTDSDGKGSATLTTGRTPGIYRLTVSATTPGNSPVQGSQQFAVAAGLEATVPKKTPAAAMARVLDSICPGLSPGDESLTGDQLALADVCDRLMTEASEGNTAEVGAAIQAFAPDSVPIQAAIGKAVVGTQITNLGTRMASLRGGVQGVSFSGLSVSANGQTLPHAYWDALWNAGLAKGANEPAADPLVGTPWGIFVSGNLRMTEKDESLTDSGFDADTTALTVGADYRLSNRMVLGGALGWSNANVEHGLNKGSVDSKGYNVLLYGTYYYSESNYFDWALSAGSNAYDITRNVDYTLGADVVHKKALADTDNRQTAITLGAGYEWLRSGSFSAEAFGRLNYVRSNIDGYVEQGAGAYNLALDEQTDTSTVSSLGVKASRASSFRWGVLVPYANLSWEHEFQGNEREIGLHLVSDPGATHFSFDTASEDQNYFRTGVGVTSVFAHGISSFIQYNTSFGRQYYREHDLALGARWELNF